MSVECEMKRHRTYSSWESIHDDQSFHPTLHHKYIDSYPLEGDMLESDLPIAVSLENLDLAVHDTGLVPVHYRTSRWTILYE